MLAIRLKEIDGQIKQVAGNSKAPRKRRAAKPAPKATKLAKRKPADGPSLKQLILEALTKTGKPMTTANVIDAVTQAGYNSVSSNFWRLVNTALREMKAEQSVTGPHPLRCAVLSLGAPPLA